MSRGEYAALAAAAARAVGEAALALCAATVRSWMRARLRCSAASLSSALAGRETCLGDICACPPRGLAPAPALAARADEGAGVPCRTNASAMLRVVLLGAELVGRPGFVELVCVCACVVCVS